VCLPPGKARLRRQLAPAPGDGRVTGTLAHSRVSILGTFSQHRGSTSLRLLVHHDVERRPRRSGAQCAE